MFYFYGYNFERIQLLFFTNFRITFVTNYETTMNTRLKLFLDAHNLTQAEFADKINVVRASVSHVLSGRNNPSYEFIRSVMQQYPALNIEWLMFGTGTMYKDVPAAPQKQPEYTEGLIFPETIEATPPLPAPEMSTPIETKASDAASQVVVNQRKVSKIIILFDDGTYQEM